MLCLQQSDKRDVLLTHTCDTCDNIRVVSSFFPLNKGVEIIPRSRLIVTSVCVSETSHLSFCCRHSLSHIRLDRDNHICILYAIKPKMYKIDLIINYNIIAVKKKLTIVT